MLFISSIVSVGCQSEIRNLQVIDTLVEKETANDALQIRYRAPKGFYMLNEQYTDSIANEELLRDGFAPIILAIHVDTLVGASMMVSDAHYIPDERIAKNLREYKKFFNQQDTWEKVVRKKYTHNNFDIVEIRCENDNYVLSKLYFFEEEKPAFVVDYFIPTAIENTYNPMVDSSIASFEKGYVLIFN